MSLIPQSVMKRVQPILDKVEPPLRAFEWTWTSAVIFSIVLSLVTLTITSVIPSWFLYFADSTLKWNTFWLNKLRDLVATGLIGTGFIVILLIAYLMQEWRRKLRGGGGASRPSGGYR
jgi:uncharacterized membrane protein